MPTSCGGAMVVVEESAEALAAMHGTVLVRRRRRYGQRVGEPLVVAFVMVVRHVLRNRAPQVPLTDWDHPGQALAADREDESLRERIQVRTPRRQQKHLRPFPC